MLKVEMYYDPSCCIAGSAGRGCYKARLVCLVGHPNGSGYGIWDTGKTKKEAQLAFVLTAASFGMSDNPADYYFQDIGERCDNPGGIREVADILACLRGKC